MTKRTNIISVLFLTYSSLMMAFSGSPALAQVPPALELADGAPDRHVVVPGDTLWDISAKFLKQPYRWPEIWRLNQEQIKNPQRIYAGQVILLVHNDNRPQLKIEDTTGTVSPVNTAKIGPRIYAENNRREIPSISQQAIEPFLAEPLIAEAAQLGSAPRIVATQEDRVNLGKGDLAYVAGLNTKAALWKIYRPGKALVDPDNNEILGHEAFYLGSARLVRAGEPATVEIISSRQEVSSGDRLLPATLPDIINYVPHAPDKAIRGRVVSVYGGVGEGGPHSIVTLSRGKSDGLEIGHVLSLSRAGAEVKNRHEGKKETYRLPDERYGLLFVFRTFDRLSYALVMNVSRSVEVGDSVANP
ncbi:MAG: LysM domain-containing protein [Pseudomonadota bacterium]